MAKFGAYVICKNQIVLARDGGIPQNDLLLRNRAVFTVMEARGTKIFHYDDHYDRLVEGARKIRIPAWSERQILKTHLKALLNKCGKRESDESVVRVIFSAGTSDDVWHRNYPQSYIPVYASVSSYERATRPVKFKAVEFCRPQADIKHTDYLFGTTESEIAEEEGYDDVLYIDPRSRQSVLETSRKNIFLVKPGGHIYTPPCEYGHVLKGITLEIVARLALEKGLCNSFQRTHLKLSEFFDIKIEGAIATSTGGVVPVQSINDRGLTMKNRIFDICRAFKEYREEYFAKEE